MSSRSPRRRTRWTHKTASELMRQAGLEPLEEFPGSMHAWRCRCQRCGNEVAPRLDNVRTRGRGCKYGAGSPADPEAEMLAAWMEPLEPYPGNALKPWRCMCLRCGKEGAPRLDGIRSGEGGCRHCGGNAPLDPVRRKCTDRH